MRNAQILWLCLTPVNDWMFNILICYPLMFNLLDLFTHITLISDVRKKGIHFNDFHLIILCKNIGRIVINSEFISIESSNCGLWIVWSYKLIQLAIDQWQCDMRNCQPQKLHYKNKHFYWFFSIMENIHTKIAIKLYGFVERWRERERKRDRDKIREDKKNVMNQFYSHQI